MDAAATPPAGKKTYMRYGVLAMVALATMINYLDRSLLAVAAPSMSQDLNLGPAAMGILFSAFSWSYALSQIPGGMFLDRFGVRLTYALSVCVWSVFTAMQGLATGLTSLIVYRLGLGAAEAPCFPANSRILVSWFPQQERARANSVYSVGMYFGIAFLSPLLFWVTGTFGWRALFIIAGAIGVLFSVAWWIVYRDPEHSKRVSQAELDHIAAGGGGLASTVKAPFSWKSIGWLLSRRQILGASIGQFATNATLVFFLTWFPTYLATERGMPWLKIGWMAVLPFIAASVGVLFGGQISDWLVRRTGSATLGRKLPIVGGLLLSATIISAAFIKSDAIVIAVMSIAFFGQGMSNLGWTLISDVAPKSLIGLTGGVFNFCTNLSGILTPIAIGFIVAATGSFFGGLAMIGVLALIGALSYTFLVGKVERINDPAEAA
ncbi:MFS transporter [Brevundimonas sp.]|uniref:MFS transporter n=1 Tax=Brevundimonas sp. TaxID=1871086 RepID=UPI0028A240AE|nr:MFS transporter [Brevundimonas sp.]